MRLNELRLPPSRRDAEEYLISAGYSCVGDGGYSGVFRKSGSPYVVKLFDAHDEAYLYFLDLAQANPNPHFPRFKGKMTRINDDYCAIRMEALNAYPLGQKNPLAAVTNYMDAS